MPPLLPQLPEALTAKLAATRRRLWLVRSVAASAAAALGILASLLLLYGSDRLWDSPAGVRLFCLLAGLAVVAVCVASWCEWRWRLTRQPQELLKLVQRRFPALGDSLQGVVDLAAEARSQENISSVLRAAAIAQVAQRCEPLDFRAAISQRGMRRTLLAALVLLLVAVALALVSPGAWRSSLARWAWPLSTLPRYTFAKFAPLPGAQRVAYGEPGTFALALAPEADWRPARLTWSLAGQPPQSLPLSPTGATLQLPGLTSEQDLHLRTGDALASVRLVPVHRPTLRQLQATVRYPDYLARPREMRDCLLQTVSLPEGSQVRFAGTVSRELRSAELRAARSQALTVGGSRFTTPEFPAADLAEARLVWVDRYGFGPADAYPLAIRLQPDDQPVVLCEGLAGTVALLEDETLVVKMHARDDYGVRQLSAVWEVQLPGASEPASGAQLRQELAAGTPGSRELRGEFRLAPGLMGIPERSVVYLSGSATDFHPAHTLVRSTVHRIFILGRTDHARLLADRFAALASRLSESVRQEEELKRANADTAALADTALKTDAAREQIAAAASGENENARRIKAIADEGTGLLREAMRNRDFPETSLKEWTQLCSLLDSIAANDMPAAEKALRNAQARPGERRRQLQDAITVQERILQKLRKADQGAGDAQTSVAARNFALRLRHAAAKEREIAENLKQLAPLTLGLAPDKLPAEQAEPLARVALNQGDVKSRMQRLQGELQAFAARTTAEVYRTVVQEMEQKKTVPALEALANAITGNRIVTGASDAEQWRQAFNGWADSIEKAAASDNPEGGDGDGGGGGDSNLELTIAILKIVQRQQELYDDTQFVEGNRKTLADYAQASGKLAGRQDSLRADTVAVADKVPEEKLRLGLLEVAGVMAEAKELLKVPRTDDPVSAAQSAVIEMLTASASSTCQSQQQCQALMQMMNEMKKERLAKAAGSKGGGSLAGGGNAAGAPTAGAAASTGDVHTPPGKTAGRGADSYPAEFRDALEQYFRQLDSAETP